MRKQCPETMQDLVAALVHRPLPERTALAIKRYYGLGQNHEMLSEIACDFNVSIPRVRQIIEKGIRTIGFHREKGIVVRHSNSVAKPGFLIMT